MNVFKKFICVVMCLVFGVPMISAIDVNSKRVKTSSNKIPIAMATDENYLYPTVVAMISMLENKRASTELEFYIMISGEVSRENRERIKVLETLYKNCSVKLLDMKDKFKTTYINPSHITTPTYYRLCLPSLLPNYDKILYLDGDIIVTKDLWEMFSTNISNCYIGAVKGFGQVCFQLNPNLKDYAKRLGIKDMNQCINAGVLIMNLKKMREDNLEDKFNRFIPTLRERKLILNDQDVLNAICYDRIKFLSPKYNAFQHVSFNYNNFPILVDCYDMNEFKKACLDPTIIHYTSSHKPWKSKNCRFYSKWDKYRKIAESKLYKRAIKDGVYTISSALNNKKVLDIANGSSENLANLQLWDSNSTIAQKFKFTYIGEEYYEIESLCSKKVLDVDGAKKEIGTNVQQYQNNNKDSQKWLIKSAGDGYYYIVSKCNGLYLEVSEAKTSNGTNIQVWEFNGSNAQKFKIYN